MASTVTRGLASIQAATILGDGGTGTAWTTYGYTLEDSCSITEDDPETTEFYVEETDTPLDSSEKAGKQVLTFQIADPDATALVAFLGGTKTTGPPEVWEAPATKPSIELSLKVTPTKGKILTIPRAKIVAKYDGAYSKKELKTLTVKATVLTPTKSGVAPVILTNLS